MPEIGLSEVPSHEDTLLPKGAPSPPHETWLTVLRRELEFLGVTQILTGVVCLYFGIIFYSMLKISEFKQILSPAFKLCFPLWGSVLFLISGVLSIMSARDNPKYLVRGSLAANLVSSIAAGAGISVLVISLKKSLASSHGCQQRYWNDFCLAVFYSTEIMAIILFLTILGFGSAILLTVYRVGELLQKDKVPEDRLYEELNIYSPIYSELEDRGETSPTDS